MSDFTDAVPGIHWYVVHTYTGYENKVKVSLEKLIENRNLYEDFVDIQLPVEKRIEGDKEIESKLFPSYVFVKMQMNDANWHVVRNITGVTGFVGPGSRPTPLSEAEVEALNLETVRVELKVKVGDDVVITGGLFEGYNGTVQAISDDLKIITVLVKRGRRDMPVEIDADMLKLKESN